MQSESQQCDLKIVEKHVEALGEHFDTVLVFCTRHDSGGAGGTVNVHVGSGNWFARLGQVREWLIKMDADVKWERKPENE